MKRLCVVVLVLLTVPATCFIHPLPPAATRRHMALRRLPPRRVEALSNATLAVCVANACNVATSTDVGQYALGLYTGFLAAHYVIYLYQLCRARQGLK